MLENILSSLEQSNTILVAVSKTKPNEAIMQLYEQGQYIFGENRVQELVQKYETLPKNIQWHLIGHLQTNKVKYIASFVEMIHSVDSLKLLQEINKQAAKHNRIIDVLLQMHIAQEETKFGLTQEEVVAILEDERYLKMENIRIVGLMGMATFTSDEKQVRAEFRHLKNIFDDLKKDFFTEKDSFQHVSMGMSGDYTIAIEEGSTMVRIGSLLFGVR